MKTQKTILKIILSFIGIIISPNAFSLSASDIQEQFTQDLLGSLSCSDARAELFKTYYAALNKLPLDMTQPQTKLNFKKLSQLQIKNKENTSEISPLLTEIHQIFTSELSKLHLKTMDPEEKSRGEILHLIRLEMRSRIHPEYAKLNLKLDLILAQLKIKAKLNSLECKQVQNFSDEELSIKNNALFGNSEAPFLNALDGAHFTMATAYQSCQSIALPPMTVQTEDVEGVVKDEPIDEVGWGRKYTNLDLLKKTHYYLRGQTYSDPCLNQDAKPLVYDYGGVPVVKSSSLLSLFSNEGGGPALGIDCSAFVSTAVAVAGHRFTPSTANKPQYTRFVSVDYIDPAESGWSCYESVQVGPNRYIQPGDIAAVHGHVVMVDQIGEDPFGIKKNQKISDCESISHKNFDFSVIQSSPSKNSIGINRYIASDYLDEAVEIKNMFVGYAKAACRSQFDAKNRTPKTGDYGIIRHKNTANCQAPRVNLVGEACISQCAVR